MPSRRNDQDHSAVSEETEGRSELVKENLHEPASMQQRMQALRQIGLQSHECDAKYHELMRNVERHVTEEAEMFPLAKEELAEDLEEISAEIQELKKAGPASSLTVHSQCTLLGDRPAISALVDVGMT